MFARYAITDAADLIEVQENLSVAFAAAAVRTVGPLRRVVGDGLGAGATGRTGSRRVRDLPVGARPVGFQLTCASAACDGPST